jgi:hypothetical protein
LIKIAAAKLRLFFMEKVTRISLTEKFRSLESICDEFDRAKRKHAGPRDHHPYEDLPGKAG